MFNVLYITFSITTQGLGYSQEILPKFQVQADSVKTLLGAESEKASVGVNPKKLTGV